MRAEAGSLGEIANPVPTLMPCIRDIARRGRRARRVRMVLNAWIPPAPASEARKLMRDT